MVFHDVDQPRDGLVGARRFSDLQPEAGDLVVAGGSHRRVGHGTAGFGVVAGGDEAAVFQTGVGVAVAQVVERRRIGRHPGAVEIYQGAVLVEQNASDGQIGDFLMSAGENCLSAEGQ